MNGNRVRVGFVITGVQTVVWFEVSFVFKRLRVYGVL